MGLCCSDRRRPPSPLCSAVTCTSVFEQPVEPLVSTTSGVRFFRLVPVHVDCCIGGEDTDKEAGGHSPANKLGMQWLGKDYAQAFDEVEFYNACYRLRDRSDGDSWRLFDFLPSFHGIIRHVSCFVPGTSRSRTRLTDLLVFRSPLEGLARPRLLNIEVGPRTCALQHRHESEVATVMFARQEGIRLEGFLAPPRSVQSEDAGVDTKGWTWGDSSQRRAKRTALQSLHLGEALAAFVDLRDAIREERLWPSEDLGQDAAKTFAEHFLGPAEFSELALLKLTRELASLLRAAVDVPVPQRWFGGSVGLLVEGGVAPPRTGSIDPEDWVAARVKVRLLGWSRSRVTDQTSGLVDEQQDAEMLWQVFKDSLGCLLWEASHLYFNGFCAEEWTDLSIQVYELGCKTDVLRGTGELRLGDKAPQSFTIPLVNANGGAEVGADGSQPSVSVQTVFAPCSAPSRLAGVWRITVLGATGLPPSKAPAAVSGMSPGTRPDVYAVVTLREQTSLGSRCSAQRTRTDSNRQAPSWKEELEFPVAAPGGAGVERLGEALGCPAAAAGGGAALAKHMLQPVPTSTSGGPDAFRMAALGQMAFIMEVKAGWAEHEPNETSTSVLSVPSITLPSFLVPTVGPSS